MTKQYIVVVIEANDQSYDDLSFLDAQDTLMDAILDYVRRRNSGEALIRSWGRILGPVEKFKLGFDMSDSQKAALAAGQAKRDANRAARIAALPAPEDVEIE